jgi:dihydrodipicolinate synthase/N-acetylneuraminate lyase
MDPPEMAGHGRLEGIFTPNMIPLDQQGNLNEPELRRYIDWMIDHGVHGLYPNGSTSEFTRFTPEERRRNIEITVEQAAGRVPVLAGAAEANVRQTLAACEYYHRLGVRAVAIVSPYYYRLSPDNVYAYFSQIGRNTPIDVTLYNIPMFASPIDVATIQRLSEECERIIGIKDSSGDVPQMMRMIEAVRPNRPDFSFLTGWDPVLMPMLLVGCDGGTNASSGVAPELTRRLYDLTKAGRVDEARSVQYVVHRLFDAMLRAADFPEGFRVGVALRGIRMGPGRQPLSDQHKAALAQLATTTGRLLAEEGLIDPGAWRGSPDPAEAAGDRRSVPWHGPESGQRASATASFGPHEVDQIVRGVLAALQKSG